MEELASDRLLVRARQYAIGTVKEKIEDGIAAVSAALDERVAKAQEMDDTAVKRVTDGYAAHTAEADRKARELYDHACSRREQDYQEAVSKYKKADDVTSFEEARQVLTSLKGYKDAETLSAKCQEGIDRCKEEIRKEEERQAAVHRQEAEQKAKKQKKTMALIAAIAGIVMAGILIATKVIIPNNQYGEAMSLMNAGRYEEAEKAFEALNGYKDSLEMIQNCRLKIKEIERIAASDEIASFGDIAIGSVLNFGQYDQDGDAKNGKEAIEWIVLDKNGKNILVTSKYILDWQLFNDSSKDTKWSTCSLRTWMNDVLLNEMFTDAEQSYIPYEAVEPEKNPKYEISPDKRTEDKLFLLSISEVITYFENDSDRSCIPTPYVVEKAVGHELGIDWWLRTQGMGHVYIAEILSDGEISYTGGLAYDTPSGIRPAMWINLEP